MPVRDMPFRDTPSPDLAERMVEWRRDIHQHPETAFQERRTASLVASELRACGLDVVEGIAGTGVVGTLDCGDGPAHGLRADMDALPIREATGLPYQSIHDGVMHACGHDGHTAMLLGAARHLSRHPPARGRLYFVFQPAEEGEAGAQAMIDDGMLERFAMQSIFGLHNHPGLPAGQFASRAGPLLAAFDSFSIHVRGKGAHAAFPETGVNPIGIGCAIVQALGMIAGSEVSPTLPLALSVTRFHAGNAINASPDDARIEGSLRYFSPEVGAYLHERIPALAAMIARAGKGEAEALVRTLYPPLVNHPAETALALAAAAVVAGPDKVHDAIDPAMGSEDFAYFLRALPGNYMLIGAGGGPDLPLCALHNPGYDFNDDILVPGARYWTALARRLVAPETAAES